MKRATLLAAAKRDPESVRRLARFLKLETEDMSLRQIIKLIVWRLSKNRMWGGL